MKLLLFVARYIIIILLLETIIKHNGKFFCYIFLRDNRDIVVLWSCGIVVSVASVRYANDRYSLACGLLNLVVFVVKI